MRRAFSKAASTLSAPQVLISFRRGSSSVTLADEREAVVLGQRRLGVAVEAAPDTLDGAAFREAAQESRR
jgi:hypothetical protein